MKKMFTLIAAALMTVGVSAQGTFGVQDGDAAVAAGTKVTSVDNITMTWGVDGGKNFNGGDKKSAVLESVLGATAYCSGNGENGKLDAGTVYLFAPAKAGQLTVGVVLNGGKNFFIQDGDGNSVNFTTTDAEGNAVTLENGGTLADKLTGGLMTFNVEAGKTYGVYCTGSKLGFYGFKYTVGEAGESAGAEAGKKLVEMAGYSLYSNNYQQLEDGTWGYVSEKLAEPTLYDFNRYYYNSKNEQAIETTSWAHYRYTYNADGTVATRTQWASTGGVFAVSNVLSYEYDADKNMVKSTSTYYNAAGEVTSTSGSMYEDFVNGTARVMKNFGADGAVTYETHYELTFNDNKQLVSSIQLTGAEFDQKNLGTFYTYEGGKLVKEVIAYYTQGAEEGHDWDNVQSTTNYTYNADGTINTRTVITDSRGMHSEVEWRYIYSDIDGATYTPQGVTADGTIGNNEVYVKWDAVSGATGYVVMYDNNIAETDKAEFITPTLTDGEHQLAVLAIVNGEKKNISDFVKASVKDTGNVPMENFKVLAAEKVDIESYGYVSSYYNLTLSWDVPAGASAISDYTVYVDKQNGDTWFPSTKYTSAMPQEEMKDSYNDVNSWVTNRQNFYWSTFEDTYYDEDTWQTVSLGTGPTCKIWITATYATGESQKSNIVEVNVYSLANGGDGTGVAAPKAANEAPVELFNLAGQRVGKAGGRQVVIVRQGGEVKKVLK